MENARLYTVDQVAELLGLHVKTVRGYVRDGKLKGTRVGKQYRIAAEDLEAFTGRPAARSARESARRTRRAEATTIVQVEAASPETVSRISSVLGAAMVSPPQDGAPLRIETVYDEERAVLKVILLGGLERVASTLSLLGAVVEEPS
ncbi:helix-turn-helix domain-containing protein [Streptomyces sp. NPDC001970]